MRSYYVKIYIIGEEPIHQGKKLTIYHRRYYKDIAKMLLKLKLAYRKDENTFCFAIINVRSMRFRTKESMNNKNVLSSDATIRNHSYVIGRVLSIVDVFNRTSLHTSNNAVSVARHQFFPT